MSEQRREADLPGENSASEGHDHGICPHDVLAYLMDRMDSHHVGELFGLIVEGLEVARVPRDVVPLAAKEVINILFGIEPGVAASEAAAEDGQQ